MPVDTLDPTWINSPSPGAGPSYDSEELRRNQGFLMARGATAGSARGGLLAVGDLELSLSGLNVRLGPGGCSVPTAKGPYVTGLAATTSVGDLTPADVTNPRRDRVVIQILDPDNGGTAGRKGQATIIPGSPNASAATGGGYPPEPAGPVLTIGYVDVPKSGAGSPTVTMTAPFTAAAGAPVPVRNQTEMDALPKWAGASCSRLDWGGHIFTCNGTKWDTTPYAEAAGTIAVPNILGGGKGDVVINLPAGRFTVAPIVVASAGNYRLTAAVGVTTTTTAAVSLFNTSTTAPAGSVATWHAVQMTPTSAAG